MEPQGMGAIHHPVLFLRLFISLSLYCLGREMKTDAQIKAESRGWMIKYNREERHGRAQFARCFSDSHVKGSSL